MTDELSARLMRAIAAELSQRLAPELKSADARERATLARLVLEDLAADLDVLAEAAEDWAPAFRTALAEAVRSLPPAHFAGAASGWLEALQGIPVERGSARQREVRALRALAAVVLREVADLAGDSAPAQRSAREPSYTPVLAHALRRLGTLDHAWVSRFARARQRFIVADPGGSDQTPAPAVAEPDVDTITQFLRRRFPGCPDLTATAVSPIPGGRSKKTFAIALAGFSGSSLPAELIMRQDYALRYEGTRVRDEYTPLCALAALGLTVPRPLLLEDGPSEVGPPFMWVERLPGSPPGSYFGVRTPCPGAFVDLARQLARLHRVAPRKVGLAVTQADGDGLLRLVADHQARWRENATTASPLVDFAFAWARRECARAPGSVTLVHGDAGPYNLLIESDRLTALLDWEFMHVGDPAVDLGIARVYAEEFMPWEQFMDGYLAAGGAPVEERRIRVAMLVQFLKGCALVAASGRNFAEGWTREFVKGANSFTGQRLIESRIAGLLQRFGAV